MLYDVVLLYHIEDTGMPSRRRLDSVPADLAAKSARAVRSHFACCQC